MNALTSERATTIARRLQQLVEADDTIKRALAGRERLVALLAEDGIEIAPINYLTAPESVADTVEHAKAEVRYHSAADEVLLKWPAKHLDGSVVFEGRLGLTIGEPPHTKTVERKFAMAMAAEGLIECLRGPFRDGWSITLRGRERRESLLQCRDQLERA